MGDTERGAKYSKDKRRRGYQPIQAVDPHDGGLWDVLLSDDKVKYVASQGMGKAKELAHTVRSSLLYPRHIYRGLRLLEFDIEEDDWLCYVAQPDHAYSYRTGERRPAWLGEVFAVCVNEDRVVYGWGGVKADGTADHQPTGFEDRFRELVVND